MVEDDLQEKCFDELKIGIPKLFISAMSLICTL